MARCARFSPGAAWRTRPSRSAVPSADAIPARSDSWAPSASTATRPSPPAAAARSSPTIASSPARARHLTHHGESAASLGVSARRGRLQLSNAESQCRARLRAARAAAGVSRGQAAAVRAIPCRRLRLMARVHISSPSRRLSQQLLVADAAAGRALARRSATRFSRPPTTPDSSTRPAWTLMHRLPAFADCPRMPLAVAESLERAPDQSAEQRVPGARASREHAAMLLLGAGGHARACIDVIELEGRFSVAGLVGWRRRGRRRGARLPGARHRGRSCDGCCAEHAVCADRGRADQDARAAHTTVRAARVRQRLRAAGRRIPARACFATRLARAPARS